MTGSYDDDFVYSLLFVVYGYRAIRRCLRAVEANNSFGVGFPTVVNSMYIYDQPMFSMW